jgi:8-oxo-dGTP pyrophosphatase MutT (NUDIX family)
MGKNAQLKKAGSRGVLKTVKAVRIFSSGGVVYRKEKNNILWFVRKTQPSKLYPKAHFMLPKGWIDDAGKGTPGPMASGLTKADDTSLKESALREVGEEGGIDAKIIQKLGTSFFSYIDPTHGKTLKFVTFFLMEYIKDLPEGHDGETAEVYWLPYEAAYKKLSFGGEKEMLKKAYNLMAAK